MGKTAAKIARVAVGIGTLGASEVAIRGGQEVKKKLIDEPAAARQEMVDLQKEQIADANERQTEMETKQENADIVAQASAEQKRKRASQRTSSAYGRSKTLLTGAGGLEGQAAPTAAKTLLGA